MECENVILKEWMDEEDNKMDWFSPSQQQKTLNHDYNSALS